MTDRIRHFTVTLKRDTRDDDAEPILDAIRMIKGVYSVEPHVVESGELWARESLSSEIESELRNLIHNFFKARR